MVLAAVLLLLIGFSWVWEDFLAPRTVEDLHVAIIPLGPVNESELSALEDSLESFYGFEVDVLSEIPLPDSAYFEPRERYKASIILDHLEEVIPKKYDKILGITASDISITTSTGKDWGVFGLGQIGGESCVVSNHRFHEGISEETFNDRLSKIAIHEIGHTLGLRHCKANENCLMRSADGTIATIDNSQAWICNSCRSKIHWEKTD